MKGAWIIFVTSVFLLLILAWLVQETDPKKGFGSRAYHMLLLGLMKLDIAWTCGCHALQQRLAGIFAGYHSSGMETEKLRQKQQRLQEFRRQNGMREAYKRKERYNRKILN